MAWGQIAGAIAGSALGGIMGGGGKTGSSAPWKAQQPYLKDGFEEYRRLYGLGGPQYFPGSTVQDWSGATGVGLNMIKSRAMGGSPVEQGMQNYVMDAMKAPGGSGINNFFKSQMKPMEMGKAKRYIGKMDGPAADALQGAARGEFLNSNPYLDQMFNTASNRVTERWNDAVMPGINATFAGAGGANSGIHRELAMDSAGELGDVLSGLASDIYGGNYARERGHQMNAADYLNQDDLARTGMKTDLWNTSQNRGLAAAGGATNLMGQQGDIQARAAALAPTAADFDYGNARNLLGAGQIIDDHAQRVRDDQVNRWDFNQQRPYNNLDWYMGGIQGDYGQQQKTHGNPLAGAIGGGLMGYGLAGGGQGNPFLGSVIGGLFGR